MHLQRLDAFPQGLSEIGPRQIKDVLPAPTLIFIEGCSAETVFVSTILHGNETTSFTVLQHLADRYRHQKPARSLLIFVGNVDAAAEGARRLDNQPDFNRIWDHGDGPHHDLAAEVIDAARKRPLFASLDIHNNTGTNPLYGCVNTFRPADLHLAKLFAPVGVYYRNPSTTQSIAFSALCPAITIECGKSGETKGEQAAIAFTETVLEIERFHDRPPAPGSLELFETVGRVIVDPTASFAFDKDLGEPLQGRSNIVFRSDLERLNFTQMPAGSAWAAYFQSNPGMSVVDEHGHAITERFFQIGGGQVRLRRNVTPAMVTRDRDVIRQDCLCYLMEPVSG